MKLPIVAIVGRPNVGKSTLFNKIAGERIAIIEDTPGVTRDRLYQETSYLNKPFYLVDTGGIDLGNERFNEEIKMQAEIAINEADVVIFVVDGKEGITSNDLVVRDILRKSKKRIIVAINKVDNKSSLDNIYDFYELGFDTYIPISAIHNTGYIELMDEVTEGFKEKDSEKLSGKVVRLAAREDIDLPVEEHLIVELYSK